MNRSSVGTGSGWPEPFASYFFVDKIGLQFLADARRALAAARDEAHSATGQALNHGYADLLGKAANNDHALVELEMNDAAHFAWPRFAAAKASRAWEYR